MRLECQYNTDLFDDADGAPLAARAYETLLRAGGRATGPAGRPLAAGVGRARATNCGAAADAGAVRPRMPHARGLRTRSATARRTASPCAFDGEARDATRELDARANRIAHLLRARGVRRGALVGLCSTAASTCSSALLGVLKAGAAYVPLDPGFPAERLAYMAEDAGLARC